MAEAEFITLTEARAHLRADADIPDSDIEIYLNAAIADITDSVGAELSPIDPLAKLAVLMRLNQFRSDRDGQNSKMNDRVQGLIEKIRCRPEAEEV